MEHREAGSGQRIVLPAGQALRRIVDDAALDQRHEIGVAGDAEDNVLESRLLTRPVVGHGLEIELLVGHTALDVVGPGRRDVGRHPGIRPGIVWVVCFFTSTELTMANCWNFIDVSETGSARLACGPSMKVIAPSADRPHHLVALNRPATAAWLLPLPTI